MEMSGLSDALSPLAQAADFRGSQGSPASNPHGLAGRAPAEGERDSTYRLNSTSLTTSRSRSYKEKPRRWRRGVRHKCGWAVLNLLETYWPTARSPARPTELTSSPAPVTVWQALSTAPVPDRSIRARNAFAKVLRMKTSIRLLTLSNSGHEEVFRPLPGT